MNMIEKCEHEYVGYGEGIPYQYCEKCGVKCMPDQVENWMEGFWNWLGHELWECGIEFTTEYDHMLLKDNQGNVYRVTICEEK